MNPVVFEEQINQIWGQFKRGAGFIFKIDKKDLLLSALAILFFINALTISTNLVYSSELINKDTLMNNKNTGVILYDRHGKPFFSFYQAKPKQYLTLDQMPTSIKQAVVASEDKDFYSHSGVSFKAIARSALNDFQTGETAYGGSTITQQLVKNSILNSNKNFLRKYQEVILAEKVEKQFSKDEILEMYLNSAYFGEGAFGIQQAAQAYFGKDAKDLNLAESTMLAGILPSPSAMSPISGNKDQAKLRQKIVLSKMVEQGAITPDQSQAALTQNLSFHPQPDDLNQIAPHFALMVKNVLVDKFGEEEVERSGFKVYTTLDLDWQQYAEKATYQHVLTMESKNAHNSAVVVEDPKTGEIRALVGSYNWYDDKNGKVNAALAAHQPGSSFKPIVYLAGFEKGVITPSTILQDSPTTFPGNYKPHDYDGKFRGPVLVRRALANSLNVPAVSVLSKVGLSDAYDMAKRLGITDLSDQSDYGLSFALGAADVSLLDMTNVYSTLANNGAKNQVSIISKIDDKFGNNIYTHQPQPEQVVSPQQVYQVTSILSDNKAKQEVFGNTLAISRPAAVKTGTTDDFRDALTIGYTPSLVIGVWLGNNDHTPMSEVAGSLGAAPLWKNLMEHFLAGTPVEKFNPPDGLVKLTLCSNGMPIKTASTSASLNTEYFIPGTEPKGECRMVTPTPSVSPGPPPNPSQSPLPTQTPQPTNPPNSPTQGSPGTVTIIINGQKVEPQKNSKTD